MKGRRYGTMALAAAGLIMAAAGAANAQVTVGVHVDWQWGNDHRARTDYGYRAARLPRVSTGYDYYDVLYRPVAGIRISRGHRPRRGFCRLWYPGVAPGHQPRPVRCHQLTGRYRAGVLVVTWQGVLRPVWDPYTDRYWRGYRDVRVVWRDGHRHYDRDGDWWDADGRYGGGAGARYKAPAVRAPRVGYGGSLNREDRGDATRRGDRFDGDARADRRDGDGRWVRVQDSERNHRERVGRSGEARGKGSPGGGRRPVGR
jgi:hypothetical protein